MLFMLRTRGFAVLGLLMLAVSAQAEVNIEGDRSIPQFGFADLKVKNAPNIVWQITPEPVKAVRSNGALYFSGTPGQTYTVSAVVVDFTAKTVEAAEVKIVFVGAKPDPIKPDPDKPNPPAPVAIKEKIKERVKADGITKEEIQNLVTAYEGGTDDRFLAAHNSPRTFLRQIRTQVAALVSDEKTDKLQSLIGNELEKAAGQRINGDFPNDLKELLKAVLKAIIDALLESIK